MMKRSKKFTLLLAAAVPLALVGYWLVSTSRAATETVDCKVVRSDGKFELRDYPELTVATTPMEGREMNSSFGKLFRFITGSNQAQEKISMTTPVLVDLEKKTMSFVMPKAAVKKGVPEPAGDGVKLQKIEAARFAVFRFAGKRSEANAEAATKLLTEWIKGQHLSGLGEPIFAYYDPPWTPVFLRRNEVLVRIERAVE
jgi:DNA gyrase inhibitor GyrI